MADWVVSIDFVLFLIAKRSQRVKPPRFRANVQPLPTTTRSEVRGAV